MLPMVPAVRPTLSLLSSHLLRHEICSPKDPLVAGYMKGSSIDIVAPGKGMRGGQNDLLLHFFLLMHQP